MADLNTRGLGLVQSTAHRIHGRAADFDPIQHLAGEASFVFLGEATRELVERVPDSRGSIRMRSFHFDESGQYSRFRTRRDCKRKKCLRLTRREFEMQHTMTERAIKITAAGLDGDLVVPESARGAILFAHGSGSSRHSSRNRYVAEVLQHGGFATLLLDLLTAAEEEVDLRNRRLRFDIDLLAGRLMQATDWLQREPETSDLPVGYFGASTGGGAALVAAASRPSAVGALVTRGGRPDLAGPFLPAVKTPTLLIVGGDDDIVIQLNREALAKLRCEKRLSIVHGATHLFEEPGTLEKVSKLALTWFQQYLGNARRTASGGAV